MKRLTVFTALVVTFILGAAYRVGTQAPAPQAGAPAALDPANFTGKVTSHATTDIRTLRYSFAPGARTNWHSHQGGQVIFVEKGQMRVMEKGGGAKQVGTRGTYVVDAGVTHWHGALPNEELTQVSLSFGVTTWMEPVTNEQYTARK